ALDWRDGPVLGQLPHVPDRSRLLPDRSLHSGQPRPLGPAVGQSQAAPAGHRDRLGGGELPRAAGAARAGGGRDEEARHAGGRVGARSRCGVFERRLRGGVGPAEGARSDPLRGAARQVLQGGLSGRRASALSTLAALYRRLLEALAAVAGVMLAALAVAIVGDVVLRNLGLQPPAHTFTLTEYSLLYLTMLAAPWLVREKGHVYIELLTAALSPRARFWLTRVVYALCVLTCGLIFWFGLEVTIVHYQREVIDVRSFDMPRWL